MEPLLDTSLTSDQWVCWGGMGRAGGLGHPGFHSCRTGCSIDSIGSGSGNTAATAEHTEREREREREREKGGEERERGGERGEREEGREEGPCVPVSTQRGEGPYSLCVSSETSGEDQSGSLGGLRMSTADDDQTFSSHTSVFCLGRKRTGERWDNLACR